MTDQPDEDDRIMLYELLYERFDLDELALLCFHAGIVVDEVGAGRRSRMIINILDHVGQRNHDKKHLNDLIKACRNLRPKQDWPDAAELDLSVEPSLDQQTRQELEAILRDPVQPERIVAYKRLWAIFEPLAKYSPPGPFSYDTADRLSSAMRHWYFEEGGGMFLTKKSRERYFSMQNYLSEAILAHDAAYRNDTGLPLPKKTVITLRLSSSLLRTSMAEDIGIGRETGDASAAEIDGSS